MNQGIFIQTNNSQLLAAKVAKFAIQSRGCASRHGIPVTLMNVEENESFRAFSGAEYRLGSSRLRYDVAGIQSFTLSRFMAPELMGYSGRALVIDPDILALEDVRPLFTLDLQDNPIAACRRHDGWESSVMLLDCAKLSHWRIADILKDLRTLRSDYYELITLKAEQGVLELPSVWNSRDQIVPEIKMLHMTQVLTQPWKTGLPVEFGAREVAKIFQPIPWKPIRRLLSKRVTHYRPHPLPEIERIFMTLLKDAVDAGEVTEADIADSIRSGFVRADLRERISRLH